MKGMIWYQQKYLEDREIVRVDHYNEGRDLSLNYILRNVLYWFTVCYKLLLLCIAEVIQIDISWYDAINIFPHSCFKTNFSTSWSLIFKVFMIFISCKSFVAKKETAYFKVAILAKSTPFWIFPCCRSWYLFQEKSIYNQNIKIILDRIYINFSYFEIPGVNLWKTIALF